MARVAVDKSAAADFMAGKSKPAAKGKKKRAEREHDAGLETAMTDKMVERTRPRNRTTEVHVSVGSAQIRGVMSETMARVYSELWPGMQTHDYKEEVDLEIAEEAYILTNAMVVGTPHVLPRQPIPMKEVENLGDTARYCSTHS